MALFRCLGANRLANLNINFKRTISTTGTVLSSNPPKKDEPGKMPRILKPEEITVKEVDLMDKQLPHPLEAVTGYAQLHQIAAVRGVTQPFETLNLRLKPNTTKDDPMLIRSWDDSRQIVCIFHEDDLHLK